jgi:hypothetical protein
MTSAARQPLVNLLVRQKARHMDLMALGMLGDLPHQTRVVVGTIQRMRTARQHHQRLFGQMGQGLEQQFVTAPCPDETERHDEKSPAHAQPLPALPFGSGRRANSGTHIGMTVTGE